MPDKKEDPKDTVLVHFPKRCHVNGITRGKTPTGEARNEPYSQTFEPGFATMPVDVHAHPETKRWLKAHGAKAITEAERDAMSKNDAAALSMDIKKLTENNQALNAQVVRHDAVVADLTTKHEAAVTDLNVQHEQVITGLQEDHADEVKDLQDRIAELEKQLAAAKAAPPEGKDNASGKGNGKNNGK